MTPRIISPIVTPNSLGAVPFRTKMDMAMGGVWEAICMLMQIIMPAQSGLKPSFASMGENMRTT